MAFLTSDVLFTGKLGNLVAYRLPGSDKIILRQKGGSSRERIKAAPEFVNTRRNNTEFKGRAITSQWIMRALLPQKPRGDYNIAGPINALLRHVQVLDTTGNWGERNIQLTKGKQFLEGFSLNRKHTLDSVLRVPLTCTLSREERSARIEIPALLPGINFVPPNNHPYYSIQVVLGVVPDLFYTRVNKSETYQPASPVYVLDAPAYTVTPWQPVLEGSRPVVLGLHSSVIPPDEFHSLILSVGIMYGRVVGKDTIEQVKRAGSAKVVGIG